MKWWETPARLLERVAICVLFATASKYFLLFWNNRSEHSDCCIPLSSTFNISWFWLQIYLWLLLVLRKALTWRFLLRKDNSFFVRKNWFLKVATITFTFQNVSLSFIYGSGFTQYSDCLSVPRSFHSFIHPRIPPPNCLSFHQSVCPFFCSSIRSYILPGMYIYRGREEI